MLSFCTWNIRNICQYCIPVHWMLHVHKPPGASGGCGAMHSDEEHEDFRKCVCSYIKIMSKMAVKVFGRSIYSPAREILPRLVSQLPHARRHRQPSRIVERVPHGFGRAGLKTLRTLHRVAVMPLCPDFRCVRIQGGRVCQRKPRFCGIAIAICGT